MRPLLDTYDLPHRVPAALRIWGLMLAVPAVAVGLWLVLPHTPAVVALLGVVVLALVFGGLARILASRQFSEPPPRRPVPAPSAEGRDFAPPAGEQPRPSGVERAVADP